MLGNESLFERIGESFIRQAIAEFYRRAFEDPIIGHFFFHHEREALTAKQISFAARMLGAKTIRYGGKSLQAAHKRLPLTSVHFNRRQLLMAEVLEDLGLDTELRQGWLQLEEKLRPLVVNSERNCQS